MTPLQRRVNDVLDALPSSFSLDEVATAAHLQAIGIRRPENRHQMGFGCQLGVFQHLGGRLSNETTAEQTFDIDVFEDGQVLIDTKARTLGKSATWTISRNELLATHPGSMIYAFYSFSPLRKVYELHGTLVAREPGAWVDPRPSNINDGFFWYASDVPKGNEWRYPE